MGPSTAAYAGSMQLPLAPLLTLLSGCGEPVTAPDLDGPSPEAAAGEPVPTPAAVATPPAAPEWLEARLLPWGPERQALTAAYLRGHRTSADLPEEDELLATLQPRLVVLHWTAGPTAEGAWNTFAPTRLAGRPELSRVAGGDLNVSAHFLVDRDGSVQRLLPDTAVARHVIGLNHLALGIENVGGGERWPLTEAQVAANVALVRWLVARHPGITHLIGHSEYQLMEAHPYFEERDPTYRTVKPDPGADFLAAVRAELQDLPLEGPPSPEATP